MSLMKSASVVALAIALASGLAAETALADLPNTPANVKIMDKNKNGRIEKAEYLAYMGAQFDKLAGKKGYCTFEEVSAGLKKFGSVFPETPPSD
ncbi:MAG: hypothetical protein A3G24_07475 [Betaproteobacteria bacterium RIFCSPLOWO2_12_FULL_62_13]|nr:MAG: hypothetical protein A3G24_07475 [Betaproteobacteria bacterium RIFCSPLOWO2_12_FULL_62_13]